MRPLFRNRKENEDKNSSEGQNLSKSRASIDSYESRFPKKYKQDIQKPRENPKTTLYNVGKQDFEELPVGKSTTNTMMDEYPPDYVPTDAQVEQAQPLIKRIHSKIWKGRQQAYIELITAFSNGELIDQFQPYLNDFISDSNVLAQEKGFKILHIYVLKKQSFSIDMKPIYKTIIEKGLTSGRAQTARLSQQILVQLFGKSEQHKTAVTSGIIEGLNNKNNRIVSCCIDAIIPLLINYGLTRLQLLKPFLRQIQKHNENGIAGVKTSIGNFFKQAYKWLGEQLMFTVNKFKKGVQDDLKAFINTYEHKPMVALRVSESEVKTVPNQKSLGSDAYHFADPVNVIDKFDERWCNHTLDLAKWVDKKAAIDAAVEAFSVPKIVNKDYMHLISFISRLIVDSNFNVNISGFKLLRNMANGLRKNFYHGAKSIYKQILFKLRDKKQMIVEEVQKVLITFLHCVPIDEMIEKIKQNLTDKAPNMRVETLNFIKNAFKQKKQAKAAKSLMETLKFLMNDATVEVRDKAFEVLCKIKSIFGTEVIGRIDEWKNIPKEKIMKIKNTPEITIVEEDSSTIGNSRGVDKSHSLEFWNGNINNRMKTLDVKKEIKNEIRKQSRSIEIKKQSQIIPEVRRVSVNQNIQNIPAIFHQPPVSLPQFSPKKSIIRQINIYQNINSPDQKLRYQTYNNLLFNPNQLDYIVLREKACVQSSQNILRLIASLIQRSFSSKQITKQALEFLMLHNWNNHQNIIDNLFKCLNVKEKHYYIIQSNPKLFNIFSQSRQSSNQQISLKELIKKLYQYSILFKKEDQKIVSLKQARELVSSYRRTGELLEDSSNSIGEIIINLKMLVFDHNIHIVEEAIQLAGDLVKICIITKMKGKVIVPIIIRQIDDSRLEGAIYTFLDKCLETQASFLFNQLTTLLPMIKNKKGILLFVFTNIDNFIITSTPQEIKALLHTMAECLKQNQDTASIAESIIDKILSETKERFPISSSSSQKAELPTKYVRKYKLDHLVSSKLPPKSIRLQALQASDPWTLKQLVPSSIQKLLVDLNQLPPPYNELASPLPINRAFLNQIFTTDSFEKYSDLYVQWLFWKFHLQRIANVLVLIQVSEKIISYNSLSQTELFILLSGSLGSLELGEQVIDAVCSWSKIFYQKNKQNQVVLFYVKALQTKQKYVDYIIKILIHSYSKQLTQYLALLSKNQIIKRNSLFLQYLRSSYNHQLLVAYGLVEQQQVKVFKPNFNALVFANSLSDQLIDLLRSDSCRAMLNHLEYSVNQQQNKEYFEIETLIEVMEKLVMELPTRIIIQQEFSEFICWFKDSYRGWNMQLSQLARIFQSIVEMMAMFANGASLHNDELCKLVNSFIIVLFSYSDFQNLCICIFEKLKQGEILIKNNKKMILLLYMKSISKLKINFYAKQNKQQSYKILIQHAAKFISQTLVSEEDQVFVHKNIKKQIIVLFDNCRPQSIQTTIDVLLVFKHQKVVIKYFDFLFIHANINNPILLELDSEEALKSINQELCSFEEASKEARVFRKEMLSFSIPNN